MGYEGDGRRTGNRDDRRGSYGKRPYRGHSDKDREGGQERRPYHSDGEHREYRQRREYHSRDGGDRPRRECRPRDGEGSDRSRREYRPKDGSGSDGDRPRREYRPRDGEHREYRQRREYHSRDGAGSDRPRREYRPRDGERRDYHSRDSGDRPRREYRPRDGERREYRPRDDDRPRREYHAKEYGSEESVTEEKKAYRPKPVLPSDPQKILFKGVDFEENGKTDLALIMYLHGAVLMNKGCEARATLLLRGKEMEEIGELRTKMSEECSQDAVVEFDYICITLYPEFDRSEFDERYSEENNHAVYCKILLGEIEGDDPIIDKFASYHGTEEKKVVDGLKYLKRKKDSVKAEDLLQRFDDEKKERQSVRTDFIRAMKGDKRSMRELEHKSSKYPEAAFFLEFMAADAEGNGVEWLQDKYGQFSDVIIWMETQLDIKGTPFGQFIRAKNIQSKENEWIPAMINAAKAGSEEAKEELRPLIRNNREVAKAFATIYLSSRDINGLLGLYAGGFDDVTYLDQYCKGDAECILRIGEELGKDNIDSEIDWLVRNARNEVEECRKALVEKASDKRYHCRRMIYALHDIGEDMESAKLYFEMEWDPKLPPVKWLQKICGTDEVKEFVRVHYEAMDDMATFESIFEDDGYRKRSGGRRPQRKGRR